MKTKHFSVIGAVILCMTMISNAKAQSIVDDKESARVFVQKFYDWYGALDAAHEPGSKTPSPYILTLKHKPSYLQNTLLNALIADDLAQEKANEIVGLDFDPFTNAQDTRSGYQTGTVVQKGIYYFIDVHDIKSGLVRNAVLSAPLVLTAEITKINGQWEFFNFIYPKEDGGYNLLDILKSLKNDRIKWAAEDDKKKQ
jgi:hypothetical protein